MQTVGFIGLGRMGRPMAKHLMKKGFPLVVHNRSQAVVEELAAAGAKAAACPAEVARQCEVLITMLPDSSDVSLVLSGPQGAFEGLRPGTVIVDMSTISSVVARQLAEQAAARGASMLDAPVSGGEIGAINATLAIMVGGESAVLERVRPILATMGNPERIVHVGPSGAGQLCKACNQLVIGGTLAAVGEAFALARKAGVDAAKVREALLGGFAASRVLDVHGERILQRNYVPGFVARMYQKDMRIIMETGLFHDVPMPVSAVVQQLVNALMAAGREKEDISALGAMAMAMTGVES